MYKEIIVSILVVVLIITGDILTQRYTRKSVEDLKEKLSNLKIYLEEENSDEVVKKTQEISNTLEQVHNVLAYYIEHDEIEKMETNFTACKSYVFTGEYSEATAELEKTKFVLDHITDKYSFTLENIF